MTQEDKELLFKDISSRLPYEIKVSLFGWNKFPCTITKIDIKLKKIFCPEANCYQSIDVIKPYLRPISSMTQKECDQLFRILNIDEDNSDWLKINDIGIIRLFTESGKDFYEIADAMDYLYSIHVDFRGLIEKSLALEAPEGMYKTE